MTTLRLLPLPYLKGKAQVSQPQHKPHGRYTNTTTWNKIDVISGVSSRATNECHMTTLEPVEFYKQLTDLLTEGFIRPTKPVVNDHPRAGEKHQAWWCYYNTCRNNLDLRHSKYINYSKLASMFKSIKTQWVWILTFCSSNSFFLTNRFRITTSVFSTILRP